MAERPKIAILASGSGTTAEYVIHATQTGVLQANVGLVISNNSNAAVFGRVARLNQQYGLDIAMRHISGKTHPGGFAGEGMQTDQEAEDIAGLCSAFDMAVLLGYMKKVRGPLADRQRAVNTHPGPLPATEGCIGKQAQQVVLDLGLAHSAQTLHWVSEEYDQGDVIAAHQVPVQPGDTAEALFDAVQATEKSWVPVDLGTLLNG